MLPYTYHFFSLSLTLSSLFSFVQVEGITLEIMAAALDSALAGRRHILAEMQRTMSQSREQVSPRAPQILHMKIAAKEKG